MIWEPVKEERGSLKEEETEEREEGRKGGRMDRKKGGREGEVLILAAVYNASPKPFFLLTLPYLPQVSLILLLWLSPALVYCNRLAQINKYYCERQK